jgi:hypothetical protein
LDEKQLRGGRAHLAPSAARAIEVGSSFTAARSAPGFRELGDLDLREIDFDTAAAHQWQPAYDDRVVRVWNVAQGTVVETLLG